MFTEIVFVVVIILATRYFYRRLFRCTLIINGTGVLVTGCDSGFGHELAKRLDRLGFLVFATCLYPDGDGAKALKAQCTDRTYVINLDVTSDESVTEALEEVSDIVTRTNCGLWGVVNNAGVICSGDIEFCTMDMYRRVMDINYFGTVRVTKAFLPMIRKSKGRIVNVTSVRSRLYLSKGSVYGGTKNAIEHFSDILRLEMMRFGVKVSVVEPGNFSNVTSLVLGRNLTQMKKEFDSALEQTSEEIINTYGLEYFHAQRDGLSKAATKSHPTVEPVLDALEDALTNECPQYRYLIDGTDGPYDVSCMLSRLVPYLPTSWMDYLIINRTLIPEFRRSTQTK